MNILLSLRDMTKALQQGKISSYELVSFYIDKIKKINPEINAVVQTNETFSLKQAQIADKKFQQGIIDSPLQGIPFTAKDWIETKDFISAAGMEERRHYIPSQNATVIDRLYKAGAILIGKTNVPYEKGETNNSLYGRTNNPYHLDYTPGGSSGGEAAIIAANGTAFGIGEDSGGSIRIPCHNCGIAGLKPNTGRIPSTGHFPKIGGFIDPRSQIGPMARYINDIKMIFPFLCGSDGLDPYVIDMPHFTPPPLHKLKIAYYIDHAQVSPSQEIIKSVEECVKFLSKEGADVQFKNPPDLGRVEEITLQYWSLYKNPPSGKEYLDLLNKWDQFKRDMMIYSQPYDAIITPVDNQVARLHQDTSAGYLPYYTLTFSLLGWPCSTVRVGTSTNGLPINIQIIAKPFREDICLNIAEHLETLCGWQAPPLYS